MIELGDLWIEYDRVFTCNFTEPCIYFCNIDFIHPLIRYCQTKKWKHIRINTFNFGIAGGKNAFLYQHVIVNLDFEMIWKRSLIIWGLSFIMPFIAGILYLYGYEYNITAETMDSTLSNTSRRIR
jgi:hypothetical protein